MNLSKIFRVIQRKKWSFNKSSRTISIYKKMSSIFIFCFIVKNPRVSINMCKCFQTFCLHFSHKKTTLKTVRNMYEICDHKYTCLQRSIVMTQRQKTTLKYASRRNSQLDGARRNTKGSPKKNIKSWTAVIPNPTSPPYL